MTASLIRNRVSLALATLTLVPFVSQAQLEGNTNDNPFRQLYDVLPTPNSVRTASGAPGHAYWQQQVDYVMDIRLDDGTQRIDGKETITYICLLYTSPSPRDLSTSRMPSSA